MSTTVKKATASTRNAVKSKAKQTANAKDKVLKKAKKVVKKVDLDAQFSHLKEKLEEAWKQGEHAAESAWHQTAVASLKWISEHHGRVDSFKKSVKGTVMEKPVNNALKAIRAEANPKPKKATVKKPAAKKAKAPSSKRSVKTVKS